MDLEVISERRVLPRWRSFRDFCKLEKSGEVRDELVAGFKDIAPILSVDFSKLGIAEAYDVLTSAIVAGDEKLALTSARVVSENNGFNEKLNAVARKIVSTNFVPDWREFLGIDPTANQNVAKLRKQLGSYPRDGITWAELALLHAKNGEKEKARRAIITAYGLLPDNRYVLRCAVRALVHLDAPDEALGYLRKSRRTLVDPWLMSAEVALLQTLDLRTFSLRKATELAANKNFSPFQRSELNAALGSIIMADSANANSKVNKLFRASLKNPTENALCQVIHDKKTDEFQELAGKCSPVFNFEGAVLKAYDELDVAEVIRSSRLWLQDEPFSSRPAITGSFMCSLLGDRFHEAKVFCQDGLRANPDNVTLLNNLALSLARLGDTEEAMDKLAKPKGLVADDDTQRAILLATEGLVNYRSGRVTEGRTNYESAIKFFEENDEPNKAAMARVYQAREEYDAGTSEAAMYVSGARDVLQEKGELNNDLILTALQLDAI